MSVRAGLARQLRLRSREVSSLYFSTVLSTLDVTHVIKSPRLSPRISMSCRFKGHTLELLYAHEGREPGNEATIYIPAKRIEHGNLIGQFISASLMTSASSARN